MSLAERWNAVVDLVGPWFWWLAAISGLLVIAGGLLLPVLIIRMPADYFLHDESPLPWNHRHPAARAAIRCARNLLGAVLLLAGVVMLVTPGQGLLTILAALSLVEFPGKRRWERRIVATPFLLRTLNAIRRKARKPPLVLTKP